MDHEAIQQKLHEHADGDYLPPEDLALVKEHLAACGDCAEEMKLWSRLRSELRAIAPPKAEYSVSRAVMRQIENEDRRRAFFPRSQIWAASLALATLLLYSLLPLGGSKPGAEEPYFYASAPEFGLEGIFESNEIDPQAEPADPNGNSAGAAKTI